MGSGSDLVPSGNKFTWINVDPDLFRHMASLGHSELIWLNWDYGMYK